MPICEYGVILECHLSKATIKGSDSKHKMVTLTEVVHPEVGELYLAMILSVRLGREYKHPLCPLQMPNSAKGRFPQLISANATALWQPIALPPHPSKAHTPPPPPPPPPEAFKLSIQKFPGGWTTSCTGATGQEKPVSMCHSFLHILKTDSRNMLTFAFLVTFWLFNANDSLNMYDKN